MSLCAMLAAGVFMHGPAAQAQNGRPAPVQPTPQGVNQPDGRPQPSDDPASAVPGAPANDGVNSTGPIRRGEVKNDKVILAFNEVPVDEVIPFIVESTGKVVMPVNVVALKTKKIMLMNDQPIDRSEALDLLITALRLNGVGVIETDDVVILDLRENIRTNSLPVLTAHEDVMNRRDIGTFVVKIYRLKEAQAEGVGERLQDNLPDYATLGVDVNSNQIILYGDIGLAQHVQQVVNELDRNYLVEKVKTNTYILKYADATAVADQIYELFDESGSNAAAGQPRTNRGTARGNRGGGAQGQPGQPPGTPGLSGPGPVVELRVSVNVRQNAITVQSDPTKMQKIRELIEQYWDLPTAQETAKVYRLAYTDPLKVRDLLQNLLGSGGSSSSSGGRGGGGGRATVPGGINQAGAGGGGGGAAAAVGDIYRIEAYPDANSIVVLSKTKDSLEYLDSVVEAIDQPSTVGLPQIIELKHANAVSLAEELNVLLAEAGTRVSLDRPPSGLTGQGPGGLGDEGDAGGDSGGDIGGGGRDGASGGSGGSIEFPWQSGQRNDDQSPESSLIGKVRIVPIVRQNALAVLAPADKRQPVVDLIATFDKPGRQVMISAVIVEVELNDDLALGVRFGSGTLTSSAVDNSIGVSTSTEGTKEDFLGDLFTSSVLDVNADLNVLIQALRQKSNVRILQEPRVFTADNQEAIFFNGQDVPFITNSNTVDTGGITQSFDYKQVGVFLNVRPRITVQRDVDLEVNLEISNIVPGQTLFGGAILDRRQTTTQVIVKNGQTIVLSGIMRNSETSTVRGIPLLEDIPLFGEIFRSRDNSKTTSELIAFITPIVVDNPSENDDNYNRDELQHLKELSGPLKDSYKKAGQRARDKIVDSREEIREAAEQYEMVEPAPASDAVQRPMPNNVKPVDIDAPVDVEELTEEPPDR